MWIFLFIRNKLVELLNVVYTTVSNIDKPKLLKNIGECIAYVAGTYAVLFVLGWLTVLLFPDMFQPIREGEFLISFWLVGLMVFLLLGIGIFGVACIIYGMMKLTRPVYVAHRKTIDFIVNNYRKARNGVKVTPAWRSKSIN